MTPSNYFIILGPINFRDGLSLFMHFLQELPRINIGNIPDPKDKSFDLSFGGQTTELARVRELQSSYEIIFEELGVG